MKGVTVVEHPVAAHYLAILRDRETTGPVFRQALAEITGLLVYEATRTLPTRRLTVETPLMRTTGAALKRAVLLAPVLRAGLGMLDAARRILPHTRVGFIGLKRDEATLAAITYQASLPDDLRPLDVLLLDPVLATGGSAVAALKLLHERGARRVRMVNLLAAPEGVRRVRRAFPDTAIFTAAVDRRLNARGYILPGLGDAGDRLFGA
jgi:uracil phosphoribosyltransferase